MDRSGENVANDRNIHDNVKEYYGKNMQTCNKPNTSACSITRNKKTKKYICDAMKLIHENVASKSLGCGIALPECLTGLKILDLGSGSGGDCFALSKLVGESGFVTGIDMTDEQLDIANEYIEHHRDIFGYKKPNVKFVKGYIENLRDAGIEDGSVDVVISNCVISLCKNKEAVLQETFRVLKDGGELYFSDMYTEQAISDEYMDHKVLWGEGLGGALPWKKLFSLAEEIGYETPRTVESREIEIFNSELKDIVGDARFASVTYRLFKLPFDTKREAQQVLYKGNILGYEKEFQFDHRLKFIKDIPQTIDGDTAAILQCSRFKDEFDMKKANCCADLQKVEETDPFTL